MHSLTSSNTIIPNTNRVTSNSIFQLMRTECFSMARGGATKKRAILVTDGLATDEQALFDQADLATLDCNIT